MSTTHRNTEPIDPEMLPLVVLMTIGTGAHRDWDDVTVARALDVRPSEARRVLHDLCDWGMIRGVHEDSYQITHRGTQNIRVYLPGGYIPKA